MALAYSWFYGDIISCCSTIEVFSFNPVVEPSIIHITVRMMIEKATIPTANQIRLTIRAFVANCSFILESCSAISLVFVSVLIGAPKSVLTSVSNISAILLSKSASGTDKPFSHFDTVWRTTFNRVANSSCVIPRCFLIAFIFSASIDTSVSVFVIRLYHKRAVASSNEY